MEINKTDNKKISLLADFGLFIAAITWGSSFPIGKIALDYYSPLFICMVRYFIGGLILGIFMLKKIKTITKEELFGSAICGTVFFLAYFFQIFGLQFTTPSTQSFLAAISVVFVPFMYWYIYKKRPDMYNCAAVVLTLGGIYLLTVNGSAGFNKGDIVSIISAFLYALHIIIVGILVKKINPLKLTFMQTMAAGILAMIALLLNEPMPTEFPLVGVLSLVHLTVMCTLLAYILQITAQKYTTETKTAIILSLESVFGTLMSVIWFKDPFTPVMLLGCVMIFVAIITAETKWKFVKKNNMKDSL